VSGGNLKRRCVELTGVVDVGGGLRGVYAAGIFDYCLDRGIKFDYCIGVSAGSANICSYAAGQARRNLRFYTDYAFRKQYMGVGNFVFKGSFINLNYVYGTLANSNGEDPLDYKAILKNPTKLEIVAAEAETGKARYFTKDDIKQDDYRVMMASSAIPVVCKPVEIDGIAYFDGALGDPVPIRKAFQAGCDRVALILTLPEQKPRTSEKDEKLAKKLARKYPEAARCLANRAERYNACVEEAREYAKKGRLIILSPDDTCGVSTLTRDRAALQALYAKGVKDAAVLDGFLGLY
jgi:predicted patatin/cPLA2 family phospholipase